MVKCFSLIVSYVISCVINALSSVVNKDRGFKVLLNVKPMHESVLFLIASSEHLFGLQKDVWREKITLLLIGCVTFQDCFQLV